MGTVVCAETNSHGECRNKSGVMQQKMRCRKGIPFESPEDFAYPYVLVSGRGKYGDALAVLAESPIGNFPVYQRKQCIVSAHSDIFTRMNSRAELTDQNIAGNDIFSAKPLNTAALTLRVSSVP